MLQVRNEPVVGFLLALPRSVIVIFLILILLRIDVLRIFRFLQYQILHQKFLISTSNNIAHLLLLDFLIIQRTFLAGLLLLLLFTFGSDIRVGAGLGATAGS